MHDAYISSSNKVPVKDIVSIEGFENKVIVGTQTGQLYMYLIDNATNKLNTWTRLEIVANKPISQMKIVPEEHLLFVLTNSMIYAVHVDRGLKMIHCCEETKGCSIFAADVKTTRNEIGQTDTRISLCVSNKRVLNFFVWKSENLEQLGKQIKLKDEPLALSFMDNLIFVGFKDEYVAFNIASSVQEDPELVVTSSSKCKSRCICLINNSIFGITKDDILIFINPSTLKTREDLLEKSHPPIKWVTKVSDLVWDEPYIVGLTANGVEIHVLEGFGPEKGTFVQAIPDLINVRLLVRTNQGDIFAASQTEIWYIRMVDIALQRKILLTQKNFKLAIELTNLGNEESKLEIVREIRISYASDLFVNKNFAAAFDEFLKANTNPCDVIDLFRTSKNKELKIVESSSHPNMPVITDRDLKDATLALTDYLIAARQKDIFSKFVSIMDTTLLKCYLKTNDSLVAPLIRCKKCDFVKSESILKRHEKLNELIILYQVYEEHAKALALLKHHASIKDSSLFGHKRTVKYLQDLDKDHKDLVFEYSQWVLAKHPEDGLTIFTNPTSEMEIPKMEVLIFLTNTNQNLVLPYLEHCVYDLNDPSPNIHEELITTYVKQIKNLSEEEYIKLELYHSKLIEFLKRSDKYCPERILLILPWENFFSERIQVLEKMNHHEEILFIYIKIQGNIGKALEYCEKVNKNFVYEILLQVLCNQNKETRDFLEPNFDIIIQVLNKYPTKMKPAKVFPLLPEDIPLYSIKNYIEIIYKMNIKKKWDNAITKGTLNAELLRLNQEILSHIKQKFTVTESRLCEECGKHFSNGQVLVRNVNYDVLHLACFKKNK